MKFSRGRTAGPPEAAPAARPDRPIISSVWSDGPGRAAMRALQALALLALAVVLVDALIRLKLVVIPVLIALLMAAAFWPLVDLLKRNHVPALLATWLTLLAAVAALTGVISLVMFAVSSQWNKLISNASQGLGQIDQFIAQGPLPISEQQLMEARETVVNTITSSVSASTVVSGLTTLATFITALILTVVVLFFFLDDGPKIWHFFLQPLHGHWLARGHRIGESSMATLGGYIRGTALIAFLDATFIGIGLAFLGIPLVLPLAVIIFIGGFVPIIGATIAGILAILVALVSGGFTTALIATAIVVGVQQIEGNVLQPMVMGRNVKLHPLVILLALTAGAILAGVIGAILAIPITAVAWTIIKVWNPPGGSNPSREKVRERVRSSL